MMILSKPLDSKFDGLVDKIIAPLLVSNKNLKPAEDASKRQN